MGESEKESVPPRSSDAWKTPLFDQYWSVKDQTPGALLFFRLGDFYELFGEDAVLAAPLLEVQLTSRNKNQKDSIPMCGVPAHAIDSYAEKLLSRGHKVALCEQVSEPGKSKLVQREVVRVLTPGLPTDYQRLDAKEAHWFYSLAPSENSLAVLIYEFLAGKIFEGEIASEEELEELFKIAKPQEILVAEDLLRGRSKKNWRLFEEDSEIFKKITPWVGAKALANLKDYLQYTQRLTTEEVDEFLPAPRGLHEILSVKGGAFARIPALVLEQWNVLPELFTLFDACGSAVGSRRLREILSKPLRVGARIRARQDVLEGFSDYETFLGESRQVYDFERILGRFRVGVAQPLELLRFQAALEHSLAAVSLVKRNEKLWSAFFSGEGLTNLAGNYATLTELSAHLAKALAPSTEAIRSGELHELVREGFDATFDALKKINETAAEWLQNYENRLKEETGIPSLKVRYNRVFGYYIEVTKANLAKVPASFQRKQTMVTGERYTTDELAAKESEILSAGQKVEARAREVLEGLQTRILDEALSLQNFIEHFAWMDAWAGAKKALEKSAALGPWVRPHCEDSDHFFVKIEEGRHPILASTDRDFVPNSLELGGSSRQVLLLTGPNMAGKSTLMRQTGLCVLLAQCGFFVPARSMTFAPASGFYSRMGASDRILSGESTFMVEMKECAQILRDADGNSLVLIDEIGRGTSTRDGLAIARAVLKHLHDEIGSATIFATHYHELSEDVIHLRRAENASMALQEWKGRLVFLRKLVFQAAESSYGIYVAKLAGLPPALLKNAQKFFQEENSEGKTTQRIEAQLGLFGTPAPAPSLADDEELQDFLESLATLDPVEVSPREAWNLLEEWVGRSRELRAQRGGMLSDSLTFLDS